MILYRSSLSGIGWGVRLNDDHETAGVDAPAATFAATSGATRYFSDFSNLVYGAQNPFLALASGPPSAFMINYDGNAPRIPSFEWTMSSETAGLNGAKQRIYSAPFNYTNIETSNGIDRTIPWDHIRSPWRDLHNKFQTSICVAPSEPPASCYFPTNPLLERHTRPSASSLGLSVSDVQTAEFDYAGIYRWRFGPADMPNTRYHVGAVSLPGQTATPDAYLRGGITSSGDYGGHATVMIIRATSSGPTITTYEGAFGLHLQLSSVPSGAILYNTSGPSSVTADISTTEGFSLHFDRQASAGNTLFNLNDQRTIDIISPTDRFQYDPIYAPKTARNGKASLMLYGPAGQEIAGTVYFDLDGATGYVAAFVGRKMN